LRGTVHSAAERGRANQLAGRVQGVRAVVSELARRATPGHSDEAVRADVRAALARDPLLAGSVVEVAVRDGIVHLSGQLTSYLSKWHAEEAAREVPGVLEVVNEIAIVPLPPRTDREIASDILAVLARHPRVELPRISVDVIKGVVHLRGSVSSRARKCLVQELVASVAGVQEVVNELTVAPRRR
jgi:osmotically-inducible protein OsmY